MAKFTVRLGRNVTEQDETNFTLEVWDEDGAVVDVDTNPWSWVFEGHGAHRITVPDLNGAGSYHIENGEGSIWVQGDIPAPPGTVELPAGLEDKINAALVRSYDHLQKASGSFSYSRPPYFSNAPGGATPVLRRTVGEDMYLIARPINPLLSDIQIGRWYQGDLTPGADDPSTVEWEWLLAGGQNLENVPPGYFFVLRDMDTDGAPYDMFTNGFNFGGTHIYGGLKAVEGAAYTEHALVPREGLAVLLSGARFTSEPIVNAPAATWFEGAIPPMIRGGLETVNIPQLHRLLNLLYWPGYMVIGMARNFTVVTPPVDPGIASFDFYVSFNTSDRYFDTVPPSSPRTPSLGEESHTLWMMDQGTPFANEVQNGSYPASRYGRINLYVGSNCNDPFPAGEFVFTYENMASGETRIVTITWPEVPGNSFYEGDIPAVATPAGGGGGGGLTPEQYAALAKDTTLRAFLQSVPPVPSLQGIHEQEPREIMRGDVSTQTFPLQGELISGNRKAFFTMKANKRDAEAAAIVPRTECVLDSEDDGITMVSISLTSAQTATIGTYFFDIETTDADGTSNPLTLKDGTVLILEDVGK